MNTTYTKDLIDRLEIDWGQGWLSPGGEQEVSVMLENLDLTGKKILDIGVGSGAPALLLLTQYGANHVTGVDIEQPVIERARSLAVSQQLDDCLDLYRVEPGELPFGNAQFDMVFSKDSFIHIADKELLFREIFRVLTPGGVCVFSDWCCGTPPYSSEMEDFLQNDMDFYMSTAGMTLDAMILSGFAEIAVRDRNDWFAKDAELIHLDNVGPNRGVIVDKFGEQVADRMAALAKRRATVGKQGHLRPSHFRAKKPNLS